MVMAWTKEGTLEVEMKRDLSHDLKVEPMTLGVVSREGEGEEGGEDSTKM